MRMDFDEHGALSWLTAWYANVEQELEEGTVFNKREFGVQQDDNGSGTEKVHQTLWNLDCSGHVHWESRFGKAIYGLCAMIRLKEINH